MKLQFLGTAAAEGIPAMFCNCEVCRYARDTGGSEIKTRSQALLDGTVLIDFPPDTYMHSINNRLRLDKIHTLIITHSHSDHFYPNDFWCRSVGIANNIEEKPLNVYLTEDGYHKAKAFLKENSVPESRIIPHLVTPFVPFENEGYKFIPLPADHSAATDPVIYIIEKDGSAILYAHDTGYFKDEAWSFLSNYKGKFDLISLDCTGALCENWYSGHMCLSVNSQVHKILIEMGLCDERTKVCINHFSHNGGATHKTLSEKASEYGYITAYDGLTVATD